MNERFADVWDALENTAFEAENLRVRSVLMTKLRDYIMNQRLTQAEAAAKFGVTQPRVSDLVRGKIDLFSVDALINMAAISGQRVSITLDYEPHGDNGRDPVTADPRSKDAFRDG
ncbi:MAG TPA: XRE family transcriptional regulator [Aeromicrobium sp.]|nr:XRE family transcriptional regulator [Aeromicrobium sp.]